MARIAHRRIFALLLASAIAATSASVGDASSTKLGKQIKIAKLNAATQKRLRHTGVAGPVLTLLGTPSLTGSKYDGLSLYRAPWSKGGTCVSAVTDGIPDGADCDPKLFTDAEPGYATAGLFGSTPTSPVTTSTTATTGVPIIPPHKLFLLQVYGAAKNNVKTARLVGPKSGTTSLPMSPGAPGYVVFGTGSPAPDGDYVELRDGAGKLLQRIQIAP